MSQELEAQIHSAQEPPLTPPENITAGSSIMWRVRGDKALLSAWGSRQRAVDLWRWAINDRNALFQSAAAALAKRAASTPISVSGASEDDDAGAAMEIFTSANLGAGWDNFVQQWVFNFLTHDTLGAVVEIIGGGDSDAPLWGSADGIAVLDTFNCFATGVPSWPIFHRTKTRKGGWDVRLMHKSRVHITTDQPIKSSFVHNGGLSALSRAISYVDQAINTNKYVAETVDGEPPPGFVVFKNVNVAKFDAMMAKYLQGERNDRRGPLGNNLELQSSDSAEDASVEIVSFSDPPTSFDYTAYTDLFAKAIAAALGMDIQEFWQIVSSGGLGTSTQSEVLDRKGKGQTLAQMYAAFERLATRILSEGFNFEFEFQDDEQDAQRANIAAQQMTTATNGVNSGIATAAQGRKYLALVDDTWRDVFDGEDIEVATDRDPEAHEIDTEDEGAPAGVAPGLAAPSGVSSGAPGQVEDLPQNIEAATSLNGAQIAAALQVLDGVNSGATAPAVAAELLIAVGIAPEIARRMVADTVANKAPAATMKMYTRRKTWSETRADFISDLSAVFERDHTGRRGGIRLSRSIRGLLRRYSEPAYRDGLESSGVERDALTTRDRMLITTWQVEQGKFVTDLIEGQQSAREAAAPAAAESKAETWADKSLRALFNTAALTADPDAMKRWKLDPAKENCITCQQLNGQIHPASVWEKSGWEPGVSKLACFGIRCGCEFEDEVKGTPAKGDLSKVRAVIH